MNVRLIRHDSKEYGEMVQLRLEILRLPLGLSFTPEQLANEKNDVLIGAFEGAILIGCCVLTPQDRNTIQLRQMAVKKDIQTKGVGREIVRSAEQEAIKRGYTILMMHARKVALGFYQKCGYEIKGEEFIEVTIPHYYMEKRLQPPA
jgi:predicted GNAT family N-acyltransferase